MSKQHLERKMEARHIRMISLGGAIGTGLFLSSGYTIHEVGPIGTIFAYVIGACIVYSVMLCRGELSVAMPYTGAFHVYTQKYIGKHIGFVVAILYWLTWTIALGSEFTAAGLIMKKWFPHSPVWVWSLILIILIYLVNILSVKAFAESEFRFAAIKVFAITAGEAKDPKKTIPEAIHTTLWRLILFFIGSIVVMDALIPYQKAGVTQSPFVYVLNMMRIPFASNLMNFVVLTAIISAANSGLYASSRIL